MLIDYATMSRGLFLDRDGTLIAYRPYLHRPEAVELLSGVSDALRRAKEAGFLLFLFTNQSGVGRGWFTREDVDAVNARMIEMLGLGGEIFTRIGVAPEAPAQPSVYRKPSPRFILECATAYSLSPGDCWMVGDSPSDWLSGLAAGIHAVGLRSELTSEASEERRRDLGVPLFSGMGEVVGHIMGCIAKDGWSANADRGAEER